MAVREVVLDYWEVIFGPQAINNLTLMLGASGFKQVHSPKYVDLCFKFEGNSITVCIEKGADHTYVEVFNNNHFVYSLATYIDLKYMPLHKNNITNFENFFSCKLLHDLG